MRIGIYGGSFNPVHAGHVGVARRAIDDLSLDRLVVVPASVSPFKPGSQEPQMPWDRVELVKAAFRDVEKAEVDLREVERGGVSYAIDTVRGIASENPGAELFFIVGEDAMDGVPLCSNQRASLSRMAFGEINGSNLFRPFRCARPARRFPFGRAEWRRRCRPAPVLPAAPSPARRGRSPCARP